jgi:ComF family protein
MNYLYDVLDDFISLLFPRICFGCGNPLMRNEYIICTDCFIEIPRTDFHLRNDNPVARLFWGRCMIEKAAAMTYYTRDSRMRRLIHNLKYKGISQIGPELGRIYGNILKSADFFDGMDLIIPVPLHRSKERQRGYNQSYLISEGLSGVSGLPVNNGLLVRKIVTKTQTRKSRYDRWTNVNDIFSINDNNAVAGKHILLVDDVITTGSTIEACADELLKCENVRVSVIALAFSTI